MPASPLDRPVPAAALAGEIAVVTGAGQGIGRGIALTLAAAGAQVALVGRTAATLTAVAEEIMARGAGRRPSSAM
ncbi:SDR family NAD(P)-dependent oxidoreductase [Nocardia sp. NPDC004568]|uniref:SDR family NAD(P)-dependent oxidoreductase n=1 Tax=Nocardia sp. NPDC004568 TaxID=3154551 RepID=UPI0033AFABD3